MAEIPIVPVRQLGRIADKAGVAGVLVTAAGCTNCFPALASLGAAVGMGFLNQYEGLIIRFLLPLFAALALLANGWAAVQHRRRTRAILGLLGPLLVLAAVYVMRATHHRTGWLLYPGLALMISVSVWDLIDPPCARRLEEAEPARGVPHIKAFWPFALLALFSAPGAHAQPAAPLRLIGVIPLPEVHGRIDHFDVDLVHQRLFMSALGNDTLEIFDLRANKPIRAISGLHEPQGVTYVPKSNRVFVANGDDGTVRMFDGDTYKLLKVVHFPSDADDTRYDPHTNRVFVGYGGDSDAALGILDGASGRILESIKLPGHPESFQLEESGDRIFVNVPTAGDKIAVISRNERKVVAMWALGGPQDNFPMALDEQDHRLFIASRRPAEVLVLDTESGKVIARVRSVGHADDMWYDTTRKRIYVSGGSGFISVIQQEDLTRYRSMAQIRTLPGGRTSCFVPELNRLYLGVWGRAGQAEMLRVYEPQP